MDNRDKYLNQHMRKRMALAQDLPVRTQQRWAEKCVHLASLQHRTAFFMMASLWRSRLDACGQLPGGQWQVSELKLHDCPRSTLV